MGVKKSTKVIMSVFLALLMIFSIAGIIGSNYNGSTGTYEPIKYNGFEFRLTEQGYVTQVNGQPISFGFLPDELDNLSTERITIQGEKVYLTIDPDIDIPLDQAIRRISGVAQFSGARPIKACITEKNCNEDIPIVTCNEDFLTFQFRKGETSVIKEKENCYVLQAQDDLEFYKVAEYLTYSNFGII